jgi:hypothetical protein
VGQLADVLTKEGVGWACAVSGKSGVISIKRGAIRTDDFPLIAHVDENVRVIKWGFGTDAFEFLGADVDSRDASIVLEFRS